ncbi:hypothetical protein [Cellvibrio sp. QJXJ]|uniref:hypothetical protein n=1 Tax=Cellvibrio sp. QJXJ TaxID=2964606 RepID=UPI0021C2F9EC|nr:hypothetical protein [Cellvibrio sp. QJXJ]UUA75130.1 hypothetical protein NNX04_21990 [Cellvibrio sp. QJXJ]
MSNETDYSAFWRSLDPDTQEVINRMDDHENLGHSAEESITKGMIQLLSKVYERIEVIAARISTNPDSYDSHLETLLIILSFSPNAGAFWFIKELVDNQPDIYGHLYQRVINQEPLQIYGKLVRERLYFHLAREQVTNYIFSRENCLALKIVLEGLARGSK